MKTVLNGTAAKCVAAVITAVMNLAIAILGHFSGDWWEPAVAAAATAVGVGLVVYLVPNSPPPVPAAPHPVP